MVPAPAPPTHQPTVVLVRHGETAWSRSGQHTSCTDLDLTATGEDQARAAGRRVTDLLGSAPDQVWSSPLRRATRTAELAGWRVDAELDDLREWGYGEMEGRTTSDIQAQVPGWSIWGGPWPGGETPGEVAVRADRVVARLRAERTGCRILLVSHGHLLRVLAARWLGGEVGVGRWLALGTAAVCQLGWEHDAPVVERWNLTG